MQVGTVLRGMVFVVLGAFAAQPALASFHFMQIEQVIGGVNGDTSAQAIQLRMRSSFQQLVAGARLRAWDATGLNPVLLIDFMSNVNVGACGRRVLITSTDFNAQTSPVTTADFTLTNPIPASYLPAGSITFESDLGTIYWRLSWGGSAYTGPTTGSSTNDADGDFGPPWPGPLPSTCARALRFQGACNALSTNNADDYALTSGPAIFTNNAASNFTVNTDPNACCENIDCDDRNVCTDDSCDAGFVCQHTPVVCPDGEVCDPETGKCTSECGDCPWDVGPPGPNLNVGPEDLAFLLGSWGPIPPDADPEVQCLDIGPPGPNGQIGPEDLALLLGNWGPCP